MLASEQLYETGVSQRSGSTWTFRTLLPQYRNEPSESYCPQLMLQLSTSGKSSIAAGLLDDGRKAVRLAHRQELADQT